MGSFTYLDQTGKAARDSCVAELRKAKRSLDDCIAQLKQQKGIGTEFLVQKLESKAEEINTMRTKVQKIPE